MSDEKKNVEEEVAKVKEAIEEEVKKATEIDDEQSELIKKVLEVQDKPVVLDDSNFELNPQELDIRKLSKKNKDQLNFRILALLLSHERALSSSLIDIIRLLMIIADKLGVDNIIQATDDIIEKQREQHEELRKIGKKKKVDA